MFPCVEINQRRTACRERRLPETVSQIHACAGRARRGKHTGVLKGIVGDVTRSTMMRQQWSWHAHGCRFQTCWFRRKL